MGEIMQSRTRSVVTALIAVAGFAAASNALAGTTIVMKATTVTSIKQSYTATCP